MRQKHTLMRKLRKKCLSFGTILEIIESQLSQMVIESMRVSGIEF